MMVFDRRKRTRGTKLWGGCVYSCRVVSLVALRLSFGLLEGLRSEWLFKSPWATIIVADRLAYSSYG